MHDIKEIRENLKEFSNVMFSKVRILDKIKRLIIKKTKARKAIFTSWSSIFASELYKFLSIILFGLTNLYISWYDILSKI